MSKDLFRRIRELERDNAGLRQRTSLIPTILRATGNGATPVMRIVIDRGNTLATGQLGIKFSSSPISNVPSAYDPTVDTSFIDGIGRGTLYSDGVSLGLVLVMNATSLTGTVSSINFDLLGGSDPDVCSPITGTSSLTVGGDPLVTVTVYRVNSLTG